LKQCSGIYTALITPFDHKGKIDIEGFHLHLRRQMEAKVDGVVVLGTTGEAATLSMEEKESLIKAARKLFSSPLMVGCGSNATEQTVENIQRAADLGADSTLVVTPFYNKPTQEGILRHFEAICHRSPLPIVLYNNPARTGVSLELETILHLAEHPKVIGIKETSGSLVFVSEILALIKKKHPHFTVFGGDDNLFFPTMALGADGVISGGANLIPRTLTTLLKLCKEGKWEEAQKINLHLVPLYKALALETHPIPLKEALKICGLPAGAPRLPLTPLNPQFLPLLKATIRELKNGDSFFD
jgi:4-hydroxy-tetrahydrodipicolinate synthase